MKSIVRDILHRRSVGEAWLLARILAFTLVLPLMLRLPLRIVAAIVEPREPRPLASASRIAMIQRYADAVCGCRLVRAQCLVRGLTRYYFLRRAGLRLSLAFGVGEIDGAFTGHCWLLKDGRPFLEPADPTARFTVMMSLPMAVRR